MAQGPDNPDDPAKRLDLDALIGLYYKNVVNYFTHVGVPRDLAPDLAQETFLRAHKSRDQFRGEASEKTWLFEIARNLFKNWLRDRDALKNRGIEISLSAPADSEERSNPDLDLATDDPLPLDGLLATERQELVTAAVAQLPHQRRSCVQLRLKGLKYSEIAEIMGVSIETVKSHLYQAREALRPLLGATLGKRRAE